MERMGLGRFLYDRTVTSIVILTTNFWVLSDNLIKSISVLLLALVDLKIKSILQAPSLPSPGLPNRTRSK